MLKNLTVTIAGLVFMATAVCAQEAPARLDLLSFAQGVLPISVEMDGQDLRTDLNHALAAIDGNPVGFSATPRPGIASTMVEMIYALPAPTLFDRFAVPSVLETPSPSQTFFQTVEILGAIDGPDGPYTVLAETTLMVHDDRGEVTELTLADDNMLVRWVKLRLQGGLDVRNEVTFFEFSEIIGNGTQDASVPSDRFTGVWDGRGVDIELVQENATVTGCYDTSGKLSGNVDGTVLRALGQDEAGIFSQFVLIADSDGILRGVRSTNGGPFRVYEGAPSTGGPVCEAPVVESLGCGDTVYGIGFEFDSADIRPSSKPVLDDLFEGLSGDEAASVVIIGHSSSEGAEDYNRDLSQRRAEAVVQALVSRGLDGARMSAAGKGEDEPIASNDDEAGRSLNRRVEISCS